MGHKKLDITGQLSLSCMKCSLSSPGGSDGKESTCSEGDLGSIPELGRSPGEEKGYPLQYSALENPMDCRVAKSQTGLSDFNFHTSSK